MRRQSRVLLLAPLALVSACSIPGWKKQFLSAGTVPVLSTERPVRVTRFDRTVITLSHPRVVGDSLIGDVGNPPERLAIVLTDVQGLEERRAVEAGAPRRALTALRIVSGIVVAWLLLSSGSGT